MRRVYLEDYARTWQEFIKDIRLVRARDLQQSINLSRLLSAPDSPLPVLLRAIVKEVTLVRREDADKNFVERGTDFLSKQVDKASKKLPGKQSPQTAREMASAEQIVDAHFEELRAFVRAPEGGKAPVDLIAPLMQEISAHLLAVDMAQKKKMAPPESAAPLKLKGDAASMPEPVRAALNELSEVALRGVQTQTRANLTEKLSQISEFCNKAINGRYPFVKSSDRDVTQEDFGRLFAPGGSLRRIHAARTDAVRRRQHPPVDLPQGRREGRRRQQCRTGAVAARAADPRRVLPRGRQDGLIAFRLQADRDG